VSFIEIKKPPGQTKSLVERPALQIVEDKVGPFIPVQAKNDRILSPKEIVVTIIMGRVCHTPGHSLDKLEHLRIRRVSQRTRIKIINYTFFDLAGSNFASRVSFH